MLQVTLSFTLPDSRTQLSLAWKRPLIEGPLGHVALSLVVMEWRNRYHAVSHTVSSKHSQSTRHDFSRFLTATRAEQRVSDG